MEVRTRNPNGSVDRIYGTIAKAASKNKFLDFRNALSLAYLEDYANIQGIGGSKHAVASGIKLLIQDNTNGSQKAEANIPCWLIDKMLEVCRHNAIDLYYDGTNTAYFVNRIALAVQVFLKRLAVACGHMVTGKIHQAGPFAEFGSVSKTAGSVFTDFQQFPVPPLQKPYAEFTYRQEKVNPYSKTRDGFVKVNSVTIQRKQFNAKGEVKKSPWTVSISNFEARPSEKKNGTTAYIPNTKRNEVALFIQVSDDDMWSCLYAVSHFISVWEMAYGIPLIQNGIAAYEYQQQVFRQQNGYVWNNAPDEQHTVQGNQNITRGNPDSGNGNQYNRGPNNAPSQMDPNNGYQERRETGGYVNNTDRYQNW